MSYLGMKQLLEAGVHFGHETKRWNPKMKRYIFAERNGIFIIDLQKTLVESEKAFDFLKDLAGRGIHTAVVSPGFTDTEMLRDHVGGNQETLDAIAGMSTQHRLIRPDEIAATIAFCIDNPVINGAVIHANLGQIER